MLTLNIYNEKLVKLLDKKSCIIERKFISNINEFNKLTLYYTQLKIVLVKPT